MSFKSFGIKGKVKKHVGPVKTATLLEFADPTYDQSEEGGLPESPGQRERESDALQASGNDKAEANDYSGAIKVWNRALLLTPDRGSLHEMKAQVLLEVGQDWEAVQSAGRAVGLCPDWPEAHLTLARAQLAIGEPEAALGEMEKVLTLKPDHDEASVEISSIRVLVLKRQQEPEASRQRMKVV